MTRPQWTPGDLGALLDLALEASRVEAAEHGMDSPARLWLGKACQCIAAAQSFALMAERAAQSEAVGS